MKTPPAGSASMPSYAIVHYNPGKRVFSDFQALLTHLGHMLHRRGWHKVLSDQRALSPFTEQEQAYIRARWQETRPTVT
ncbi:hypothetical protein, partial [Hymenobacter sp. AT01-02]|uniref:hypothetical protein n=1 Tax=Hymenobacter sp. AT01-02 TaxID=1571877 RepID=UPI00128F4D63